MKRISGFLLCCILVFLEIPQTIYAGEITSEKYPLDIVFVIDCSGSMKYNDPSHIGLSMVQAFIDTLQTDMVRVGYVAYSDKIVSYSEPESIENIQRRTELKNEIASIEYSGDTDIGMALSFAYSMFHAGESRRQVIVLISDGETDLPAGHERTEEESNYELTQCVTQCSEENIQIYTIAFARYDGNILILEEIAAETGAESYSIQSPNDLIEVLYGIFQDSMTYRIQQYSSATYAGGCQEIKCVLDSAYLDEINILLLSSGTIKEAVVQYSGTQEPLINLSHYAVGKIGCEQIDNSVNELTIQAETQQGQDLRIYVIYYRKLIPVIDMADHIGKNQKLEYLVSFMNGYGEIISDKNFYESFSWELDCITEDSAQGSPYNENVEIKNNGLNGSIYFDHSGTYTMSGALSDDFGTYPFTFTVTVTNAAPTGAIPEKTCTLLGGGWDICLDDYFTDADEDQIYYSITDSEGDLSGIQAELNGNTLTVKPLRPGENVIVLQISDGENEIQYRYCVRVVSLWQTYWWLLILVIAILFLIVRYFPQGTKHKEELENLVEEKKQNRFYGKMDAYFVVQPENEDEIPPLSFRMNRINESKISLGSLFSEYQEQAERLDLQNIYLIADEKNDMILYHISKAGVMVGNSIACKQIQYRISFGNVIYITSPGGEYDMELHYVAVFQ